jgi:hypothetical protein
MEDSEKIAHYEKAMGFIEDQMKLERYFLEVDKVAAIEPCRADAYKRIVEALVGPMALSPSNLMKAQARPASEPAAQRKAHARKSPAKKRQSWIN